MRMRGVVLLAVESAGASYFRVLLGRQHEHYLEALVHLVHLS